MVFFAWDWWGSLYARHRFRRNLCGEGFRQRELLLPHFSVKKDLFIHKTAKESRRPKAAAFCKHQGINCFKLNGI